MHCRCHHWFIGAFVMVGGVISLLGIGASSGAEPTTRPNAVMQNPLPPGQYTGPGQVMSIETDGKQRYNEGLTITHIRIDADGTLHTAIPKPDHVPGQGIYYDYVDLKLTAADPRAVCAQTIGDNTYKVTAIPFGDGAYVFRQEVWRSGNLVGGEARSFTRSANPGGEAPVSSP